MTNIKQFDRKTFDPDAQWRELGTLRNQGHTRAVKFDNLKSLLAPTDLVEQCGSTALKQLALQPAMEAPKFVDAGCGLSPDAALAQLLGYESIGVDLFPPSKAIRQADVVESLSFDDDSIAVVVSQAVIDLIEPENRMRFYTNVAKALLLNGLFSQYGCALFHGYGFSNATEVARLRELNLFRAVDIRESGFVAIK